MEKVFQINLAGMVFTIEEQAYLQLKSYLDRLHAHFAGNGEIVQDIEGRMAELFANRISSIKKILYLQDVNEVTSILGDINQMDEHGEQKSTHSKTQEPLHGPKKLRRHAQDQSLGGVCSGLASFFDVDPVLIRVLFVIMVVAYGSGVLLYLVLWIVIPEAKGEEVSSMQQQRQNKTRRLFRDAENRVIGGVSAGLSAYFNIDRTWIRLAFLVSLFVFGTGFWLYVILWIIVPKAVSATDKLLMRGEPVDIHSIEKEIKQGATGSKVNSIAEHGSNVIGIILKGMLKLFGAFIALILFVMVMGISIAMVAVFFNLGQTHFINELISFTVKDPSIILAAKAGVLLCILVPLVTLLMFVIKVLFRLTFFNKSWLLSLGGLFLIGVICLAYSGVRFGSGVSHHESSLSTTRIAKSDTLFIEGVEMPFAEDDAFKVENETEIVFYDKGVLMGKDQVHFEIDDVKIKQGKTDSIVLKVMRRSNGADMKDAEDKIEMIEFTPTIIGNKIIIPSYFSIDKNKQFSWQEVDVTLWIPAGVVIHVDDHVREILDDMNLDEADGSYYQFIGGTLTCLDCGEMTDVSEENIDEDEDNNIKFSINNEDEDVEVEINVDDKTNSRKKKTKKIIKKDGETILVEEAKAGPISIKTTKKVEGK